MFVWDKTSASSANTDKLGNVGHESSRLAIRSTVGAKVQVDSKAAAASQLPSEGRIAPETRGQGVLNDDLDAGGAATSKKANSEVSTSKTRGVGDTAPRPSGSRYRPSRARSAKRDSPQQAPVDPRKQDFLNLGVQHIEVTAVGDLDRYPDPEIVSFDSPRKSPTSREDFQEHRTFTACWCAWFPSLRLLLLRRRWRRRRRSGIHRSSLAASPWKRQLRNTRAMMIIIVVASLSCGGGRRRRHESGRR